MYRSIIFFLLTLVSVQLSAGDFSSALIDVNKFWAYETTALSMVNSQECNLGSNEMIQMHLRLVHDELLSRDISHLSSEQQINRLTSLQHLQYYAERGVFPQNLTHSVRRPVFIDQRGVHCAVGYLISASGSPELSQRISANMNTFYLKDMQDEALSAWVARSGFTLNELAWIQPGYPVPVNWDSMKGGMDGPVHTIASDSFGDIFAAGYFDTAGGYSAHNAAHWYSGFAGFDWMGLHGSGTNGPVADVLIHNNETYLAGAFSSVDTIFTGSGVVKWNGTGWESLGQFYIGGLLSYVNDLAIYRDTLYAGGFFRSDIGAPEFFTNLAKWDGLKWVPAFKDGYQVQGEVKSLHVHDGALVVGGDFQLSDSAQTANIFKINGQAVSYFNEALPYTVNDLASYAGDIYAACPYDENSSIKGGLVKYDDLNNHWYSRIEFTSFGAPHEVLALEETPYGLAFGGNFNWDQLLGFFIVNAGLLSDSSNTVNAGISSLGILDSSVTCLHYRDGYLYEGGYFEHGLGTLMGGLEPLGHIAKLEMATIGLRNHSFSGLEMYPNPASNRVMIELPSQTELLKVQMLDITGRLFSPPVLARSSDQVELSVEEMSRGSYILNLITADGIFTQKLIIR